MSFVPTEQLTAAVPQNCLLPPIADPTVRCNGRTLMHYYDSNTRDCEEILYSGCGGSANLFNTEDECEIACEDYIDRLNSFESEEVFNTSN